MEFINKLETRFASWYKNAPHLPVGGQKWLADNIWWLVLIMTILGVMGVLGLLGVIAAATIALTAFSGPFGIVIGGIALIIALVAMTVMLINIVLYSLAISPLKAKRKKGWTLVFATVLVSLISVVVAFLFTFEFFSFLWGLTMAAVMAYFLFEIREYFGNGIGESPAESAPEVIPPVKSKTINK